MSDDDQQSAWMCHVCDRPFLTGVGEACSVCYKVTCPQHLKRVPVAQPSGVLVLEPVCVTCQLAGML